MKELSIEEKARRYDEAINVTTNLVKAGLVYEDAAIQIFPQLNKIEDERIRKALISRFNESGELDGISYDNIRAWLEKQGEQNPTWSKEDEIWIDRACMLLDELNHLSTLTLAKIPSNVNDIISHLESLKQRIIS